ncbi:MAG: TIGR03009 domain-containing protein [Pirellulales bacterium]
MRRRPPHVVCLTLLTSLGIFAATHAQQPAQPAAVPPSTPLPPAIPQATTAPPAGFQLNQIQQAYLDQVLVAWEQRSAQINTFSCPFQRWDFNAFRPAPDMPHSKDPGVLSYQRPDKGSFQITEVKQWVETPQPPGFQGPKQGDWKPNPNAVGEHWVCDGKSVYEYRHNQKQLVVSPIPPDLQGNAIVDGPLPFLFGAEAAKLKARYWLRLHEQSNPEEIWVVAVPRFQADAANFQRVTLILDRQQLIPKAMQVAQPGGTHVDYLFDFANAKINGTIDQLFQALFQAPRTPWGWQRVDQPMPTAQQPPAVQPQQPPLRQAQAPAVTQ